MIFHFRGLTLDRLKHKKKSKNTSLKKCQCKKSIAASKIAEFIVATRIAKRQQIFHRVLRF